MKFKVNIEVKNKQKIKFGEDDLIKNSSDGIFYIKDDVYYLVYEDFSEGIEGARTTLKIDPIEERVLLLRADPAAMKQNFCIGEKTRGYYQVDDSKLRLEVETTKINFDLLEDEGKIKIEYVLYLMGEKTSESSLKINYKKKGVE